MTRPDVEAVRKMINTHMGSEVMLRGSDPKFIVGYMPTGLLPIDILLQGGLPRGRHVMIQGDWSTLKTLIGQSAIGQVQQAEGIAALIDAEHAFDPDWAEDWGVDTDDLLIEHPETGEEAMDAAEIMVRSGVDLIVVDSMAAVLPQAEANKRKKGENVQPGRQAALFSEACRKLTAANSGKTCIVWINQLRENIGITFGKSEKAPGGRAVPFYSTYILEVKKAGKITRNVKMFTGDKWQDGKEQIGQTFRAELLKSKLSKPHRNIMFDYSMTSSGIDIVGFLFAQGLEYGLIKSKGASYTFQGKKIVGKDNFRAALGKSEDFQAALCAAVLEQHTMKQPLPYLDHPVHTELAEPIPIKKKTLKKTLRKAG